jgi:heme O synthase-like polyprenyltransferase
MILLRNYVLKIKIYLKLLRPLIMALTFFVLSPWLLLHFYMPEIPHQLYLYLIVLIVLKFMIFNDQAFKSNNQKKLDQYLSRVLKRPASKQEIVTYLESGLQARDIVIVVFALIGVFMKLIP